MTTKVTSTGPTNAVVSWPVLWCGMAANVLMTNSVQAHFRLQRHDPMGDGTAVQSFNSSASASRSASYLVKLAHTMPGRAWSPSLRSSTSVTDVPRVGVRDRLWRQGSAVVGGRRPTFVEDRDEGLVSAFLGEALKLRGRSAEAARLADRRRVERLDRLRRRPIGSCRCSRKWAVRMAPGHPHHGTWCATKEQAADDGVGRAVLVTLIVTFPWISQERYSPPSKPLTNCVSRMVLVPSSIRSIRSDRPLRAEVQQEG